MKKYFQIAFLAIAISNATYPTEALAVDPRSAAAINSAASSIQQRKAALREILESQGVDGFAWWQEKYAAKFSKTGDAADTFYRWSGLQILNIAISDGNGTEPVPIDVIAQIQERFNQNGFTNKVYGNAQAYVGGSNALESSGISKLAVDEFVTSRARPSSHPKKITHIAFEIQLEHVYDVGPLLESYGRTHPENPTATPDPIANYEILQGNSGGNLVVIGIPNSVLMKRKCAAEEIISAVCLPFLGIIKVDIFHVGN